MAKQSKIVVINNVRYRREDAFRLGLITEGKAFTQRSQNVGATSAPDEGTPDPAATSPEQPATGPEQPARNASRDAWLEYAKAQGVQVADLENLKRDEISEMFPDDPANESNE